VVCILVCTVRFAADERAACALHEVHRPHHTTDNTTTRSLARVNLARSVDAGVHCQRHVVERYLLLRQLCTSFVERTSRCHQGDWRCTSVIASGTSCAAGTTCTGVAHGGFTLLCSGRSVFYRFDAYTLRHHRGPHDEAGRKAGCRKSACPV
jgi:hypothetical protein